MEGYFPTKLKRKELDEVNDDFCDFSLSSPARKIRRLDAELPPIIEEEEMMNPAVFEQPIPSSVEQVMTITPISLPDNEERAIVLYDPINNIPSLQSRSPFSFSVNADFLSRYKSKYFTPYILESLDGKTEEEGDSKPNNGTLAVVPWVAPPSQHHHGIPEVEVVPEVSEMMDADDMEAMTMDIEDDNSQQQIHRNEMMNQWQQHCMIPEPPRNLSTPIAWSGTGV